MLISFSYCNIGYQDPKKVPSELVLVCLRRFTAKKRNPHLEDETPAKLSKASTLETYVMDGVPASRRDLDISINT